MNELLSSLAGVIVGAASSYFAQKKITKSIIDSEIKRLYAQAEINDKSKRLDEIRECVVDILVLVEPIANREIDNMAVITNIHRLAMFLDVKNNPEHGELNGVVINLGLYIDELAVNGRSLSLIHISEPTRPY